jgi:hypothetical protein
LSARQPVELRVDHQVFARGQFRIGGEGLRDHANNVANAIGIPDHVVPAHLGRSGDWRGSRRHHANQRSISRAIRPEQADDFPRACREARIHYIQPRNRQTAFSNW